MRRAQAALEFLTTYGWAFIVILVMIGALAYFGVLNPSKVTPSRCIVEAGISCGDFMISNTTGVNISLVNGKGEGMTISAVTVSSDSVAVTSANCKVNGANPTTTPVQVTDSGIITIGCNTAAPAAIAPNALSNSIGDKIKFTFSVTYKMAKGTYNQQFGGSIYGQVQQ